MKILRPNFLIDVGPRMFKKLLPGDINPSYHRTSKRLILLDYDGTMSPSQDMIDVVNALCSDPKNTVFILTSGRKDQAAGWFAPCERLGISAEHGCLTRWTRDSPWKSQSSNRVHFHSKTISKFVMEQYTDAAKNGSFIEFRENSVLWHYEGNDMEFGACQAKELREILTDVLAKEPVYVESSAQSVEVIPQGLGKGMAVRNVIETMETKPDFILCVGEDQYDTDLFKAVSAASSEFDEAPETFTCTVGNKLCVANYYLNNQADVRTILEGLANAV